MQQNIAPPSAAHPTIGQALAGHVIEAELRSATPRAASMRQPPHVYQIYWVGLALALACLPIFGIVYPLAVLAILILLLVTGAMSLPGVLRRKRQTALLERGIAHPAVVTQVEETGTARQWRITYNYVTTTNPRESGTFFLSEKQMQRRFIERWQTFTVLVNPDNEQDAIPYFQIDTCDIAGAKRPCAYSAPLQPLPTVPLSTPVEIAAETGVEPELYCIAPRRTMWTPQTISIRLVAANVLAGAGLLLLFFARNPAYVFLPPVLLYFALSITMSIWLRCEWIYWYSYFFVREGIAVRAIITRCEIRSPEEYCVVQYAYPGDATGLEYGYVTIPAHTAKTFGGMQKGSTLTVLRHPDRPSVSMPYFAVTGVDVAGGKKAVITPPGATP